MRGERWLSVLLALGAMVLPGCATAIYCHAGVAPAEIRLKVRQAEAAPGSWRLDFLDADRADIPLDEHGCCSFVVSADRECVTSWFGRPDDDECAVSRPFVELIGAGIKWRAFSIGELTQLGRDAEGWRIIDVGR